MMNGFDHQGQICDGSFFGFKATGTEPTKEATDE